MVRCDLTMCASSKIIIHFEFRIPYFFYDMQ